MILISYVYHLKSFNIYLLFNFIQYFNLDNCLLQYVQLDLEKIFVHVFVMIKNEYITEEIYMQ